MSAPIEERLRRGFGGIVHQARITDFVFIYLNSDERHVNNAIDAAIAKEHKS